MKKDQPPSTKSEGLRRMAEEQVLRESARKASSAPMTKADAFKLVHELQVHQIELEMQNEELRRAQAEIIALGARYRELYDFAPVGYLTLDSEDRIVETNLAGATLLGIGRRDLINQSFVTFLSAASQTAYRQFVQRIRQTGVRQTCEFSMLPRDAKTRYLQAEGVAIDGAQATGWQIRLAILDITDRRQMVEESTRVAHDIHDTLEQSLTEITLQLQAAEHAPNHEQARVHICRAQDLAQQSLQEARRYTQPIRQPRFGKH